MSTLANLTGFIGVGQGGTSVGVIELKVSLVNVFRVSHCELCWGYVRRERSKEGKLRERRKAGLVARSGYRELRRPYACRGADSILIAPLQLFSCNMAYKQCCTPRLGSMAAYRSIDQ